MISKIKLIIFLAIIAYIVGNQSIGKVNQEKTIEIIESKTSSLFEDTNNYIQ